MAGLEEVGLETQFHRTDLFVAIMLSLAGFIGITRALGNLIGNCVVPHRGHPGRRSRPRQGHAVLDGAELVDVTAG